MRAWICDGSISPDLNRHENLGAETVALSEVDGQTVHALLAADRRLRPGDEVHLSARPGSPLFFDGRGELIATGGPGTEGRQSDVG